MIKILSNVCASIFLIFSIVSCKPMNSTTFISSISSESKAYAVNDIDSEIIELNSSFVTAKFDKKQNLYFEFVHPDDIKLTGKEPVPFFRITTSISNRFFSEKIWNTISRSKFQTPEVQIEEFEINADGSSIDEMIHFTVRFDNKDFIGKSSRENIMDGISLKVEFKVPKIVLTSEQNHTNFATEPDSEPDAEPARDQATELTDQQNAEQKFEITAAFEMFQSGL